MAFSESHLDARKWFARRITEAGLELYIDGAGNHSGIYRCNLPDSPTLLLGSHLDTVPTGGKYDGALGVLAALEVLRCVKETNLNLPFNLEAIDFTDEEGTMVSVLGSLALCGLLKPADLENPSGNKDDFTVGLKRAGLSIESILSAKRSPSSVAGYLELHVEQGHLLEESGDQIGVVTSITGITLNRVSYHGEAGHAGTTDMRKRRDAAQGAAAFTLAARRLILDKFPECTSNVGAIEFLPGAYNVIPQLATLGIEFRAGDESTRSKLNEALTFEAREVAERFKLDFTYELIEEVPAAMMNERVMNAIHASASMLGLKHRNIVSRAGHDAQPISTICPTGMIFVPSVNGISHSPLEYTAWQDCVNGANVLLHSVLHLANNFH